jgi:hypothetical protein
VVRRVVIQASFKPSRIELLKAVEALAWLGLFFSVDEVCSTAASNGKTAVSTRLEPLRSKPFKAVEGVLGPLFEES